MMTRRLEPFFIRLYDPNRHARRSESIGYEFDGAYMVTGLRRPDIAALQETKALEICTSLGARTSVANRAKSGEHRYDFL